MLMSKGLDPFAKPIVHRVFVVGLPERRRAVGRAGRGGAGDGAWRRRMVHGSQRRGGRPRPGKLPDQDLTAPSEEPPPLSDTHTHTHSGI